MNGDPSKVNVPNSHTSKKTNHRVWERKHQQLKHMHARAQWH